MSSTPASANATTCIDFADPHALTDANHRVPSALGDRWALTWDTPPQQVWQAHQLHEVAAVLDAAHAAAKAGAWCVGHVRYEAAPAFDAAS